MNTKRPCEKSRVRQSMPEHENIDTHFQPEFVLSAEDFAALRRKHFLASEIKPALEFLEENFYCFQRYLNAKDEGGKMLFQDAANWIFEEGADWNFSFENICMRLGLNPASLREALRRWKENKQTERASIHVFATESNDREERNPIAQRTGLSIHDGF
jgi:hypothetical protein